MGWNSPGISLLEAIQPSVRRLEIFLSLSSTETLLLPLLQTNKAGLLSGASNLLGTHQQYTDSLGESLSIYGHLFWLLTQEEEKHGVKKRLFPAFLSPSATPEILRDLMYKAIYVASHFGQGRDDMGLDAQIRELCQTSVVTEFRDKPEFRAFQWTRICEDTATVTTSFIVRFFQHAELVEFKEVLRHGDLARTQRLFPLAAVAEDVVDYVQNVIPLEVDVYAHSLCLNLRLPSSCEKIIRKWSQLKARLGLHDSQMEGMTARLVEERVNTALALYDLLQHPGSAYILNGITVTGDLPADWMLLDSRSVAVRDVWRRLEALGALMDHARVIKSLQVYLKVVASQNWMAPSMAEVWPVAQRLLTAPNLASRILELHTVAHFQKLTNFIAAVFRAGDQLSVLVNAQLFSGPRHLDKLAFANYVVRRGQLVNFRDLDRLAIFFLDHEFNRNTQVPAAPISEETVAAFVDAHEVEATAGACCVCTEPFLQALRICPNHHEICKMCFRGILASRAKVHCPLCRVLCFPVSL